MKKVFAGIVLVCMLVMAGCTGGSSGDSGGTDSAVQSNSAFDGYTGNSKDMENIQSDATDDGAVNNSVSESGSEKDSSNQEKKGEGQSSTSKVDKNMLVYRGSYTIDSLEFNKSVEDLSKMLDKAGGFIESENFSDGGTSSVYYMEDTDKHRVYTAYLRVPSEKYDSFTEGLKELGDIRVQNSSVDNITTQYNQMQAKLKILTAKRDRYIELVKNAKSDSVMIQLESELTNLEMQISDLTNSISSAELSVAYSYVNITINAVRKYNQKPDSEDSRFEELRKSIVDSASQFADWVWDIVIWFVYAFPYIIVYAGIIIGLVVIVNKRKRSRKAKEYKKKPNESDKNAS